MSRVYDVVSALSIFCVTQFVNTNTCTYFIKKPFKKTPTCFGLRPSSGSYNILAKVTII